MSTSESASFPRPIVASRSSVFDRVWHGVVDTSSDSAGLIARLVVAMVMFPHGAQHAFGWFGGYGFSGTYAWMTGTVGLPGFAATLAIFTEVAAPLALLFGVGGRIAAAGIIGVMLGALSTHLPNGFFMNWAGALPAGGEGYEYHLLMIALAVIVAVKGSGLFSVDRRLSASRL